MRQKFKWQINDYNTYAATNVICQVIGNIFGTYVLNQMLRVPEIVIGIVGYFSAMVEYIICGLANQSWQLYLGEFCAGWPAQARAHSGDAELGSFCVCVSFCSFDDCIAEGRCGADVPVLFGGPGAIE